MKKRLIYCIFLYSFIFSAYGQDLCPIIPLPEYAVKQPGIFDFNRNSIIFIKNKAIKPVAHFLQNELLRTVSVALPIQEENKHHLPSIILEYNRNNSGQEAYKLDIDKFKITISGKSNEALFNGINSLLQLILSKQIIDKQDVATGKINPLDCWLIKDKPSYGWRGLMLDESRHFFGKEEVKKILNWMAFYKLNRFHWHLTDGDGWRIEIKSYPKLALIGGIGNRGDANAPARFYTQEDIKEIVAYAKERFITVIPEIDMPGHANASNRAYPEFSGGGSEKFPDFTFNPGKEGTYQYLTQILREVDALFPSEMIHIGGDEVYYGNEKWATDPDVIKLMVKYQLPDMKSVEHYFFNRMADSILKLNNKILAWDEAADASIPVDKAIIFWWRPSQTQLLERAFSKGYKVVMCPRMPFYLDYSQDYSHIHGPFQGRTIHSSEDIYNFSPDKLPVKINNDLILGLQVNLWTEMVRTSQRLEFMLFPRMAALAETAWTSKKNKNFEKFKKRLETHFQIYRLNNIYYYDLNSPSRNGEPIN